MSGGLDNVRSLRSFLAFDDFEFNRVAFLKALVAFRADRAIVHKYIGPIRAADEPVALGVVEPLYGPFQSFH